jgi:hypothetical protein
VALGEGLSADGGNRRVAGAVGSTSTGVTRGIGGGGGGAWTAGLITEGKAQPARSNGKAIAVTREVLRTMWNNMNREMTEIRLRRCE